MDPIRQNVLDGKDKMMNPVEQFDILIVPLRNIQILHDQD